jgi:hypothetical protein
MIKPKSQQKQTLHHGYIYQQTRKNIRVSLIFASAFFAFYIWYMFSALIYLPNAYASGYTLNKADLLSSSSMLPIEPQTAPFDNEAYGQTVPAFITKKELYMDGLKYRFKFTVEDYTDTGLKYTVDNETGVFSLIGAGFGNDQAGAQIYQKLGMFTIDGKQVVGLLPSSARISAGDVIDHAVFIDLPIYAGHDLGLTEYAGTEVASYCLDLRGLEVEDESNDFILVIVATLLFPTYLGYYIVCLFKPRIHTNYLRIAKFAPDIEKVCYEIDDEVKEDSAYMEGKSLYTTHYIIQFTAQHTKVLKNHMLRH